MGSKDGGGGWKSQHPFHMRLRTDEAKVIVPNGIRAITVGGPRTETPAYSTRIGVVSHMPQNTRHH